MFYEGKETMTLVQTEKERWINLYKIQEFIILQEDYESTPSIYAYFDEEDRATLYAFPKEYDFERPDGGTYTRQLTRLDHSALLTLMLRSILYKATKTTMIHFGELLERTHELYEYIIKDCEQGALEGLLTFEELLKINLQSLCACGSTPLGKSLNETK